MNLVLENLKNQKNRFAQFRTVICLLTNEGKYFFEGKVKGTIREEKKGNGGFGYDPIFEPEGYSCTFAEMRMEEKNKISHRAIATQNLVKFLKR